MSVKVSLKHLHISPRKVRLVADLVRGVDVSEAEGILKFTQKGSARPILKLLNSAIATAENDHDMIKSNLLISEIFVDEAPTMKRWRPRAYGRAYPIMKRSSHITLILDEKVKGKRKKSAKKSTKKDNKSDIVKIEDKAKEDIDSKEEGKKSQELDLAGLQKDAKAGKGGNKVSKGADKGFINKMFRRKSGQ